MIFCTTCTVSVTDSSKFAHFKSDWHVYNLKRVVAKLPPISVDAFEEKKVLFTNESEAKVEKKTYCQACKRSFLNSKSFEAHLTSGKHIKNAISINGAHGSEKDHHAPHQHPSVADSIDGNTSVGTTDGPEQDTREPESLPLGQCLFCDKRFVEQLTDNAGPGNRKTSLACRTLAHMSDVHHFQVPYPDKLVDPVGLLLELGRIVGEERACLHCGRQFYGTRITSCNRSVSNDMRVSLMSVRSHMLQKNGHLRLWCGTEDPIELALAQARAEEEQQLDSGDNNFVPPAVTLVGGEHFSQFYDRSVVAPSFLLPEADDDTYEARLPSGSVIGHRTMRIVYHQYLSNSLGLVNSTSNRCLDAPVTSISGERLPPQNQQSSLSLATGQNYCHPIPLVSRAGERRCKEWKQRWDMLIGQRGNLVNRMHIRRQY